MTRKDQEMPQPETADQPMVHRESTEYIQLQRNYSKATSYLFLNELITKLERTHRSIPQNGPNTKLHTQWGVTTNNK